MKLVITRPEPGASATAKRAASMGFAPILMPLFEIIPVKWSPPQSKQYDALLISSANAIRHGGRALELLRYLPVVAVGTASAKAAMAGGFNVQITGDHDAQSALNLAHDAGYEHILWLAGEHRADISPPADTISVYTSRKITLPPAKYAALGSDMVVTLYSARAAQYFTETCDKNGVKRGDIILAALSPAIAGAAGSGWRKTVVADVPDDIHLLKAAATCFTNGNDVP